MTLSFMIYTLPGLAGVIAAVFGGLAFVGARDMAKKFFTCQKSGTRFKGKWYEFLAGGYYSSNDKTLRCPHCRKRTACSVSFDQKEKT